MTNYKELLKTRNKLTSVESIQDWVWINEDNGAWDGPKADWESSHYGKILKYVKNFNTVIQAGGNQGMYPRLLSDMFRTVYTFEPDPLNFHCLVHNCQKDNIHKFNAALGEFHNMIRINRGPLSNAGTHTVSVDNNATSIQLRIDDLIGLQYCDLIWLDIEGYEYEAIKGAAEIIGKFKPVIILERPNHEVRNFLSQFGYVERETSHSDVIFTVS
jgi:FkbM family methyltransferase